ncbi:hypothetical protein MANI_002901 [Metarhizium anisopliae]
MSLALTNGAVAQTTKILPPDEPFGQGGNPDWLRQIYQQLHIVYGSPPKRRVYRTTATSPSKDLEDLSSRFQHWRQNPESSWETPSTSSANYIHYIHKDKPRRAQLFLQSAVQLDSQITELRVLQRFVAVSAYELFLRIVPRARERISAKQMADFLIAISLQAPSEDSKKYAALVRRGRDWVLFCSRLHEIESHNIQSPPLSPSVSAAGDALHAASFDSPGIYGPLFVCSIDDSIFGSNGLFGSGKQQYIKQLSEAGLSKAAREYGANQTAKILLGYHQNLFWLPSTTLESLDSLIVRKRKAEIECGNTKKKPRNDSESETNLRCDNMVSPQVQQGHQPTSLTRLDGIDVLTPLACSPDWFIDATSLLPLFRIEDFFYSNTP